MRIQWFGSLLVLALANSVVHGQSQCGKTSRQKHLVLRQPAARQLATLDSCVYHVAPWSAQVCQVRIDFEQLELPQPEANGTGSLLYCVDYLQVQRFTLCGTNTGQHLYVPMQRSGRLQLQFKLSSRSTQATWHLTLTQLECPRASTTISPGLLPRTVFNVNRIFGGLQVPSPILSVSSDVDMLAPLGCDQFYRSSSGTIASFNYPGGIYMPDTRYSICVRGTSDSEITYTIDHFALSKQTGSGPGYDTDCHATVRTEGRVADYLLVPRSFMANNEDFQPTYYCGNGLAGTQLRARPPFVMHFVSDAQTSIEETGFRLTYNVQRTSASSTR